MIGLLGSLKSVFGQMPSAAQPTAAPAPTTPGYAPDSFVSSTSLPFAVDLQAIENKIESWFGHKPAAVQPTTRTGTTVTAGAGQAIALQNVHGQYIKDPSFANDGQPISDQRYIAFGNLRQFFLKGFSAQNGQLDFSQGEIPINISGLSRDLDGRWAPQVVVQGDQVRLFYTAGEMHPGQPLNWPTYRLHMASMPLAQFEQEAKSGKGVTFQDQGTMFNDQKIFGGSASFAMIDPDFFTMPDGKAYMAYTVVRHDMDGSSPHQEFVRYRQVDPNDPTKAIGPDMPMVDGWSKSEHEGVAEAESLATIKGQTYAFISSRPGDTTQRVLVAPVSNGLGRISDQNLKPVLTPGKATWESNAVGSTDETVIDGRPYILYQGMDKNHQFNLGWAPLKVS